MTLTADQDTEAAVYTTSPPKTVAHGKATNIDCAVQAAQATHAHQQIYPPSPSHNSLSDLWHDYATDKKVTMTPQPANDHYMAWALRVSRPS